MTIFNRGVRGKRSADGTNIGGISNSFVENKYPIPTITSWSISGSDDDALDTAGGQTVLVNGGGFATGVAATLNGTTISPVTLVSPTQISFTSPALSGGSYTLIVYNSTGGAAILVPGLTYSSVPTYTTSAGSIGSVYETTAINTQVVATSDSSITYSLASGSLPSGATLYANGVITGTAPVDSSSTTYSFAITATDAELQDVTRSFTLTINTDVVTWVTPSSGATINLDGSAYSQALNATDAASYAVSYTANALPTGLTLTSGTISGTPTVEGSTTTLLTATAATTGRSATNTVTWVVALNDVYWKYNTLLLSANSSIETNSFISDNSINNTQLTITGDTRPNNFNPYLGVYYSVSHSATPDYLSVPHNSNFSLTSGQTDTFIIEGWFYFNVVTAQVSLFDKSGVNGVSFANWTVYLNASSQIQLQWGVSGTPGTSVVGLVGSTFVPVAATWYHIAFVKSSADWAVFANGTRIISYNGLNTAGDANPSALRIGFGIQSSANAAYFNGYISNVRTWRGTSGAPYSATSSTLTVPTSPLTAIAGTTLLSHQSARFVDNSLANATLTATGANIKAVAVSPFSTPTTAAYNTQYSTYFDGTGDYLSLSGTMSAIGTNDFTVEMWIRVTTSGTYNVLDFTPAGSNGAYLNFYLNSMTPMLYVNSANRITGSGALNINQWYHVAISRLSGNTRMFIDGTQSGSTWPDSTSYLSPANRPVLCTSGNNIGANYMPGIVSNLRIINGTGYSSITPSTSPLTAVAGTSLLTCQNATLIDNSTNNFTITSYADARPIAVSPFTMTTSNTTVTSLGSTYFDGTGDYISAPNSPSFYFGTGDFTVEFWMYLTTAWSSSYGPCIGQKAGDSYGGWIIYRNTAGSTDKMGIRLAGQSGAGNTDYFTTVTPATGVWQHWAVVRSGTTLTWYCNGISCGTTTGVSTNVTETNTSGLMYIGRAQTWTVDYLGYLSDVRVVKGTALYTSNFLPPQTPLTSVTNTQLLTVQTNGSHNNSTFKDNSSFNNLITRSANATNGTFSPYGDNWSNYFDGTTDVLTITSSGGILPTTATTFTIEAWVYLTALQPEFATPRVPGMFGDINGVTNYFSFGPVNYSGLNYVGVYWYDSTGRGCYGTTTSFTLNTWTHIAISVSSNTIKLFVNGTLQTLSGTTTLTNRGGASGTYVIGGYHYSNQVPYTGYISNLRVVNGTALYSGSFTTSSSPLTSVANTSLLTCQSNRFVDNSPNNFTLAKSADVSVQKFSPFSTVTVPKYYSAYFDGSGDYITVADNAAFEMSGDFTVEAWFYATTFSTYNCVVTKGASGIYQPYYIFINSSGNLLFYSSSNGSSWNVSSATSFGTVSLNAWYHVAVSREGSAMRLFLNGNLITTITNGDSLYNNDRAVGIGCRSDGTELFTGYISNVRIVKGVAVYTGSFPSITSPLTAISGTSLLTCQNNTFKDNSTNLFTVVVNGDTKPLPVSPFTPTASSVTSYSPTVFGGSMYFDGTGDKLTIANYPALAFKANDFTIQCWFYTNVASTEQVIMTNGWASYAPWLIRITTGNQIYLNMSTNGGSWYVNEASFGTVTVGQWYHMAVSRSSGVLRAFLNGIQGYTTDFGTTALYDGSQALNVGGRSDTSVPMNGYISDAQLINGIGLYSSNFYPGSTPATPSETLRGNNYNSTLLLNGTSGGVIDATRTVDFETVGDAKVTNFSPYNGSYYSNNFDGSGDYLLIPSSTALALSGDYTIECWVYFNTLAQQGIYSSIDNSSDTWQGPHLEMYTNYAPRLVCYSSGGTSVVDLLHQTTMIAGKWYHIAAVRASNTTYIYLDGVRSSTSSSDSTSYTQSGSIIGSDYPGTRPLNGYVSNFRVLKGTALYSGATFTVPTSPLTVVSNTSLLTCQSNGFIDNSVNAFTITASGDTKVATRNPFQVNTGLSYYFDGTGDSLYAVASPNFTFGTGNFTIEFWLYFNATANRQDIMWISTTGAATDRLGISWNLTSGNLTYYISPTIGNAINYAWTPTAGQWYHIALARSSGSTKLFVNGTQGGSTYSDSRNYNSQYAVYVGQDSTGLTSPFNGYISDLRITRGYARYTTTFTPPTTPVKLN